MKQVRPMSPKTRIVTWSSVFGRPDFQSVLLWLRRCGTCIFALFLFQVAVFSVRAKAADEKPANNEPKLADAAHDTEIDPSLFARTDIEFDVQEEPRTLHLIASDPDAIKRSLDMKYAATVRLDGPRRPSFDYFYRSESRPPVPVELTNLTYMWGRAFWTLAVMKTLDKSTLRDPYSSKHFSPEYFRQLAAMIPKEKLPADTLLSFFTEDAGELRLLEVSSLKHPSGSSDERSFEFHMLAPTEDEAHELAKTLLLLFDWGLARQMQIHARGYKRDVESNLDTKRAELDHAQEIVQVLREQLETPADVNLESLPELKTQRHLASVDLAGAKARIVAAERFLAQKMPRLSDDRVEQVENLKIAAEIELAGLAARQQALDALIRAGEQRIELHNHENTAEVELMAAKKSVSLYERKLSNADEEIKLLGPLQLHEGKVLICPVKWIAAMKE